MISHDLMKLESRFKTFWTSFSRNYKNINLLSSSHLEELRLEFFAQRLLNVGTAKPKYLNGVALSYSLTNSTGLTTSWPIFTLRIFCANGQIEMFQFLSSGDLKKSTTTSYSGESSSLFQKDL